MIFIISDKRDMSTHRVLDRLCLENIPFLIVYPESRFKILTIEIGDFTFELENEVYSYVQLSGMWMRKGYIPDFWDFSNIEASELPFEVKETILINLKLQKIALRNYLIFLLDKLPCINKIKTSLVNKLTMLEYASESGFSIPNTLVTNDPKKVYEKFDTEALITKSVDRGFSFNYENFTYGHNTIGIKKSNIISRRDLGYSIFQNQLSKSFELRIFHFFGKNYAMAIFSQQDDKTKVDFRNYNNERPNRNVPYELPISIEKKINYFMDLADLNTGSLDIVVTEENDFVFLEVNPVGQWEILVSVCNYNIHKMIVEKLKEFINARKN